MGGRTPTTLRPRGAVKCEYCGRSVSSRQALETHQKTLHSVALRRKERIQGSKKPLTGKPKPKPVPGNPGKVVKKVVVTKTDTKLVSQRNGEHKALKQAHSESKPKNPVGRPRKRVKSPVNETKNSKNLVGRPKILVKNSPNKTETSTKSPEGEESKKELPTTKMDAKNSAEKSLEEKKTEFKCPKCEKCFSMCFSAQKHIQKHHCVNGKGETVDPDSPDLIQPIQVEFPHVSTRAPSPDTLSLSNLGPYGCVACVKTFDRLMNFQKHVSSMHNEGLESLLFPTIQEFETWRRDMESQTKTLYVHVGKLNNKQFYQCCSTLSNLNDISGALSCPSLIVYQHYPSGIQVHFYKTHFDHECKPYCMEDMYKNYSITDMLHADPQDMMKVDKPLKKNKTQSTEIKQEDESEEEQETSDREDNKEQEEDLYVKFKTIMENIITDAARINIDTLKTIVDKAMTMQDILKSYNEDIDLCLDNSSLTSFNTSPYKNNSPNKNKRKSENMSIISPLKKKLKTLTDTKVNKSPILQHFHNKKVNSYSLADNKDDDKILKELDLKKSSLINKNDTPNGSPKKMVTFPKFDCSPSAFHDSYKNFVSNIVPSISKDKNSKSEKGKNSRDKYKQKSSPKFKTKIGLFNPSSPKRTVNKDKNSPRRNTRESTKGEIEKPEKVLKAKGGNINKEQNSYRINTRESTKSDIEKPEKVFKAKGGPKSKREIRDFKYEVKERDNDCNILILKL